MNTKVSVLLTFGLLLLFTAIGCDSRTANPARDVAWNQAGKYTTSTVPGNYVSPAQPNKTGESPIDPKLPDKILLALSMHEGLLSARVTGGLGIPTIYEQTGNASTLNEAATDAQRNLICAELDGKSHPATVVALLAQGGNPSDFTVMCVPTAVLGGTAVSSGFSAQTPYGFVYCDAGGKLRIAYIDGTSVGQLGKKLGYSNLTEQMSKAKK